MCRDRITSYHPKWIKKYVNLHAAYSQAVGVVSRDIYLDLREMRLCPVLDDKPLTKLYRWAVRPWLERPHPPLLKNTGWACTS